MTSFIVRCTRFTLAKREREHYRSFHLLLFVSSVSLYLHISVTNCDGIVRVAAYAFRHDGVLCHLHTHSHPFPLLQMSYIEEGVVTHDRTRTKRERINDRRRGYIGEA